MTPTTIQTPPPERAPLGDCQPEPFQFDHGQRCPVGEVAGPVPESSRWIQPISVSPDGALLASAYRNGRVIWRTGDGGVERVLGPAGSATVLAWSPDGYELVSDDCEGHLMRTDAACGRDLGSFAGHRSPSPELRATTGVAFNSDGSVLYSVGSDKALVAWSVASGEEIGRTSVPEQAWALAISPGGTHLVVSHEGGGVVVDASSLAIMSEIVEVTAHLWSFASDDELVATLSEGAPVLMDLDGGNRRDILAGVEAPLMVQVHDGMAAVCSRTAVSLAPIDASTPPITLESDDILSSSVVSVAFAPDGKTVYANSEAGGISAWSVPDGARKFTFKSP